MSRPRFNDVGHVIDISLQRPVLIIRGRTRSGSTMLVVDIRLQPSSDA